MSSLKDLLGFSFLATLGLAALASPAVADDSPAHMAVEDLQTKRHTQDVIQNRFFLKSNRFEIAPALGMVPNNPFSRRYLGGVFLAYHLSESFAAEGALIYSPDMGVDDLKGLTGTLVQIAEQGGQGDFQQPVDKLILGATFAARWAPIYGKINLVGERVLNFDFYGTAGLGLLSVTKYYATWGDDSINLTKDKDDFTVPINLGVGFNFFLNQSVALKLDARSYLYVSEEADYDPSPDNVVGNRMYNTFIATAGVSVFIPKMKPRLFDF